MTTILAFLVVLGLLIFFHELGHFLAAKWMGVGVQKFSLGFGPRLLGRRVGETEYVISAVPLGGYVKMIGQEDLKVQTAEEITPEIRQKSFLHKPLSSRMVIVAAGPAFNFLLAFLIFAILHATGVPVNLSHLGEVQPGSAAEAAGLKKGDRVTAIDGQAVRTWDEMVVIVRESPGKPLRFAVEREGRQIDLTVTPELKKTQTLFREEVQVGQIGVMNGGVFVTEQADPFSAIGRGAADTWRWSVLVVTGIVKMIQGTVPVSDIGGPIFIAHMSGQAAQAGVMSLLIFVAIISINLAIINLFPIPILDGGHLLFLAIEGIRRKPLNLRMQEVAQQVGLFLIIGLIIFAFYNDLSRFSDDIVRFFKQVVGIMV